MERIELHETIDRRAIYKEGEAAGRMKAEQCPYPLYSAEGQVWLAGYENAGGFE